MEIIHHCHKSWRRLITGEDVGAPGISLYVKLAGVLWFLTDRYDSRNITIQNSPGFVSRTDPSYTALPEDSRKPAAPIPPSGEHSSISRRPVSLKLSTSLQIFSFGHVVM